MFSTDRSGYVRRVSQPEEIDDREQTNCTEGPEEPQGGGGTGNSGSRLFDTLQMFFFE